ncbi:Crp/Fnr family transcriptional regulator [Phreatobacter aquaticus]|uniref:Crp/Fnr family transcriptional regulator n=1 Tax=Phreatobacter aquaticus TaxID=2570229 RepID=A0A4D7QNN6_9HYPH|nr:Crp/Fnr family transcriptional regulator [Phreatobacter aquaticus]QCK86904.1 Crp/Fnr family transcriptional regulator [Phreatobacter aquaticus]
MQPTSRSQAPSPAESVGAAIATIATFGRLDDETRGLLGQRARILSLPREARPFGPGSPCEAYLIVLKGEIRVQIVAESGREIVLYRVSAGESCVLTTSCLLKHEPYSAEAICETAVSCLAIPESLFSSLLGSSTPFRSAVLDAYATRVTDLIMTFEELVFRRLDQRLAAVLVERSVGGELATTHHDLAVELGSAREVVSRALKVFEQQGLVTLGRGIIRLLEPERLTQIARSV